MNDLPRSIKLPPIYVVRFNKKSDNLGLMMQ